MKHIVIYMYIKAVTNNVKLRLYLWHDIYNIFFKIEQIFYCNFKFSISTLPAPSAEVCARAWVCFILLLWLKTLIYNFLKSLAPFY
jgi:hypothetical protein